MKQMVYQIKGMLTSELIEAMTPRFPEAEGVSSVDLQPSDGDREGYMTVTWTSSPSDEQRTAWEDDMDALLGQYGELSLARPPLAAHYVTAPTPKKGRTVPLSGAIGTVIVAVVLAVLSTFFVTTAFQNKNDDLTVAPGTGTSNDKFGQLEELDRLFRAWSPLELDDQALLDAVLKGYVEATGDTYARYYTQEEFDAYMQSQTGNMVGIGISITEDTITVGDTSYQTIRVINVFPNSPAEEAGVLPGDAIMYIGTGETHQLVDSLGYEKANTLMIGEAGSVAEFEVFRASEDEPSGYEIIPISAVRREISARTVQYRICATDATVGIVRITSFDETTPPQFDEAIKNLKDLGCTRFVLDLRYNPGGMLTSVVDVLAYFTQVGDTVITVKDKYENERKTTITDGTDPKTGKLVFSDGQNVWISSLEPTDIGKYRNMNFTVLTNEFTASAAELFAANMRDYELATLVGDKTYGKGSIQTFIPMVRYGYEGALKITYGYYYPPSGNGYHGEGVKPHVVEPMSEEALAYKNFNLLPDDKDNQLQKAIEVLDQAD